MPTINLFGWLFFYSNVDTQSKYYSSRDEYLEHFGQWVIRGEKSFVENTAVKLWKRVGRGIIHELKYSLKPTDSGDYLLFVYCDDRRREDVKRDLELLGAKTMKWKYQRKSIKESKEYFSRIMELRDEVLKRVKEVQLKHNF